MCIRDRLFLVDGHSMTILEVNETAPRMLGYTRVKMLGANMADVECALSDMFFWDDMREREQATADSTYRCADGSVLELSVSYTHLDVYKRQIHTSPNGQAQCGLSVHFLPQPSLSSPATVGWAAGTGKETVDR